MRLILAFCLIAAVTCAKLPKRPKKDPYADFADDKDLEVPEDDDDKPPTNFVGNVQVAKTAALVNRNYGQGKFKNSFQTENGIQISQVGKLKDNKTFVVMGSYSYTGADGRRYRVKYTADELGYHPITELEVDIPELNLTSATIKPFAFNRAKLDFENFKNKLKNKETLAKIPDSKRQTDKFGVEVGGPNVKNNNNSNNNINQNKKNAGYQSGKPSGGINSRTYLPPKGYLPPSKGYLPPQGFKPPSRDYN